MLQNAYFLAKIGADTAENEQQFAENLPKIGNCPTGPSGAPDTVDDVPGKAREEPPPLPEGAPGCMPGCMPSERFESSKFKFPRARTYQIIGLVLGCIEAKFFK